MAALFVALAAFRAWGLETNIGTYTGCHGCFWMSSLGHDARLFTLIAALLALGSLAHWRWLRLVACAAAALGLLAYAGDIATNALLSQRLYFADVLRFGPHAGADLSILRAALAAPSGWFGAVVGVLVVLIAVALCVRPARRPRAGVVSLVAASACAGFSLFAAARDVRYVHEYFLANVIETNLPQGRLVEFSPAFIERQRERVQALPEQCGHPAAARGSAIIVMVESLSAWHSQLLGSTRDWTPHLDAVARENHYFRNFYANGFTTSHGEIAIIDGRVAFPPSGKAWFAFDDYADPRGNLVDIAHRSGRSAAFFTTGDLSFLNLGKWLQRLGFDNVNGHDDPFYADRKRWQFGAAEDAALFERVLAWMDRRDHDAKPFVSVLETVSSHPPFIDPRSGRLDAEATFRYVDEQIGVFYAELKRRGFFEHGLLIVVGDHRTMTPLHEEEYLAYGERAYARIPMIVAGAVDMPPVVEAAFQQTDIAPSLAAWFGLPDCRTAFSGDFLRADPQPADYVLHARGDDRNRVDVYYGGDGELGSYQLNGDRSTWSRPPPQADTVAAWIDWQRELARVRGGASSAGTAAAGP